MQRNATKVDGISAQQAKAIQCLLTEAKQPDAVRLEPLLLGAEDAATLLGVGRTLFYGMYSSGRLGPLPIRLGRRTLWRRVELEGWVRSGCPSREKWQARKEEK